MNIQRTSSPDGIAVLTFDRPGSSANVFDRETLEQLDDHLTSMEKETGLRGVVLASAWRVASTDKATKLGLPETQLGILPAWGGSTRLPKLIGLPSALGMILTGKQLVGAQALKIGVVDELTHPEYLLEAARKLLARGKRRAKPAPGWMSRAPLTSLVASKARK